MLVLKKAIVLTPKKRVNNKPTPAAKSAYMLNVYAYFDPKEIYFHLSDIQTHGVYDHTISFAHLPINYELVEDTLTLKPKEIVKAALTIPYNRAILEDYIYEIIHSFEIVDHLLYIDDPAKKKKRVKFENDSHSDDHELQTQKPAIPSFGKGYHDLNQSGETSNNTSMSHKDSEGKPNVIDYRKYQKEATKLQALWRGKY